MEATWARRFAPLPTLRSCLTRRGGVDGERVHALGKLGGERGVDQAMPFDPALPGEGLSHDIDPEVALAARPMTRMPLMLVGFVDDPQGLGPESLGQLSCDEVMGSHDFA